MTVVTQTCDVAVVLEQTPTYVCEFEPAKCMFRDVHLQANRSVCKTACEVIRVIKPQPGWDTFSGSIPYPGKRLTGGRGRPDIGRVQPDRGASPDACDSRKPAEASGGERRGAISTGRADESNFCSVCLFSAETQLVASHEHSHSRINLSSAFLEKAASTPADFCGSDSLGHGLRSFGSNSLGQFGS